MAEVEATDQWLDAQVLMVRAGEVPVEGFAEEAERVFGCLACDEAWALWWSRVSKAPVLEILVFVTRPPRGPLSALASGYAGMDEEVRRGRKRHRMRASVDPDRFFGLDAAEQRLLTLPMVLGLIDRVVEELRLSESPPPAPEAASAPPLPASTLRRRRLRELRGEPTPTAPARPPLSAEKLARQQAAADMMLRAREQCPATDAEPSRLSER
jgi:hypothetical protein